MSSLVSADLLNLDRGDALRNPRIEGSNPVWAQRDESKKFILVVVKVPVKDFVNDCANLVRQILRFDIDNKEGMDLVSALRSTFGKEI